MSPNAENTKKTQAPSARFALSLFLLFLAAACSTPPRPAAGPPVYFPPLPELPRIQYLTTFSGRKDIEEQSSFNRFVVGEKPNIKIDKPYGVAMSGGKIYVCDTNASVAVFDLENRSFGLLKGAVGPGSLRQPVNISIDEEGKKYVSDPVRGQIVVFDKNDEFSKAYGSAGSWRPVDAVRYGENLYVADNGNGLIKVFDLASGQIVRTIGDKGDPSERLDRPTNIAFDKEGYLYVTDVARFQVVKFDRDGHFRSTFGSAGDSFGHFARPKGIAVDRDGRLLAVDASFNNVQVFNKDGRILLFFGQGGVNPGDLELPAKVSIDYDNVKYFQRYAGPGFRIDYLIFVTNQFGDRRVNVFASGKQEGKRYPTDEELLKQIEDRRKQELESPKSAEPPAPEKSDATRP